MPAPMSLTDLSYGHLSHAEMASKVRMLMRHDLEHEGVCVGARDRIVWLAQREHDLLAEVRRLQAERDAEVARAAAERMAVGARDVLAERRRQVKVEGWTPEHDDEHAKGEMAEAAAAYALHASGFRDSERLGTRYRIKVPHPAWPWSIEWWKPKDPRRDLVRAGALILAEIERLDRSRAPAPAGECQHSWMGPAQTGPFYCGNCGAQKP